MSSSIRLVDYDPQWPILYEEEKASILGVIGDLIVDIQHIGSTAVPGLGAKPIIDIVVAIRRLALIEKCVRPLQTIGYEYLGEYGIPGRYYFRKPPGHPHTHITCTWLKEKAISGSRISFSGVSCGLTPKKPSGITS